MQVTPILVAVLACAATSLAADPDWWKRAVVYQVYPRSLKDNDGNGIGDLDGITSKLDYFPSQGIDAIWFSPIFRSPMADFGYDISDYTDVDPIFGTLQSLEALAVEAHARGLKVILDFVPNHSSDEHEWFKRGTDPTDPEYEKYKNYYVWQDAKIVDGVRQPPNNWLARWEGSTWEWNEVNQQYYYHYFLPKQPDLNYRNRELVEEMKNILRFWLDRGIDGFRMDAVPYLVEKQGFPDYTPGDPDDPMQHEQETYEIIQEFRSVLDEYEDKVMMTEAYGTVDQVMGYYGNATNPGAHFSFNFLLITDLNRDSTAQDFVRVIDGWINTISERGVWSNWVIGNHDQKRAGSRYSEELIDGLNMLVQLLPGTAVTYYGEEIGMVDNYNMTCEIATDPQGCLDNVTLGESRDPNRTPFQWDATTSAGFSSNSNPWLPVNDNYREVNVAVEEASAQSHLKTYRALVALRQTAIIQNGATNITSVGNVFAFTRTLAGESTVIVAVNLGQDTAVVNLRELFGLTENNLIIVAKSLNSGLDETVLQSPDAVTLEGQAAVTFQATA